MTLAYKEPQIISISLTAELVQVFIKNGEKNNGTEICKTIKVSVMLKKPLDNGRQEATEQNLRLRKEDFLIFEKYQNVQITVSFKIL